MTRWHVDTYEPFDPTWGADAYCPACDLGHQADCVASGCDQRHIHAFTDAELRARDERIIRALANRIMYDRVRDGDGYLGLAEIVRQAAADTLAEASP